MLQSNKLGKKMDPYGHGYLYIPEPIITKILLLLPFESLVTCKLVSKQWNDMIKDPKFIRRYRDKPLALFTTGGNLYCIWASHRTGTGTGSGSPPLRVRFLFRHKFADSALQMAANGMAFAEIGNPSFIVFNLFTGVSRLWSKAPVFHPQIRTWSCYGFGHDVYDGRFKILLASVHGTKGVGRFFVCSSRSNRESGCCWKLFSHFPYHSYNWGRGSYRACYINGLLHWLVPTNATKLLDAKLYSVVVTYDLHSGKFSQISTPVTIAYTIGAITELGGQLCYSGWGGLFHVSVMKHYGVHESWTLLFTIDPLRISMELSSRIGTHPYAYLRLRIQPYTIFECEDGRRLVLLVCHRFGTLYWYDIDNDQVTAIPKHTWLKYVRGRVVHTTEASTQIA